MATPGVRTTVLDRFYNLARTDIPGGPTIAVIGKRTTANNATAPDLLAYQPNGEQDVIAQFGENSQLHRAYYELTTGGANLIVLIPLPSNTVFDQTNGLISSATYPTLDIFGEAFSSVESSRADIVVPYGRGSDTYDWDDFATPIATPGGGASDYFYADNSSVVARSWAKKVADKCADITLNSYPVIGVLGVKGIAGTEIPTPSQITTGFTFTNLVDKETITTGSFVSIVATENRPNNAPVTWGWSNGACLYAAIISRLNTWSATTNKPLYNIERLRYNPTRVQADALGTRGIVTAALDFQRRARWVDGTTFAVSTSDFTRLSTMRIVFDAVKLVRNVSQNYIGEGMSTSMRNAFETQVSSSLRSMQVLGAINQSDFRVQYAPSLNRAYIDIALIPAFELREVVVQISVNF